MLKYIHIFFCRIFLAVAFVVVNMPQVFSMEEQVEEILRDKKHGRPAGEDENLEAKVACHRGEVESQSAPGYDKKLVHISHYIPLPITTTPEMDISFFQIQIRSQGDIFSCGYHAALVAAIFQEILRMPQNLYTQMLDVPMKDFQPEAFTVRFNNFFAMAQKGLRTLMPEYFTVTNHADQHMETLHGLPRCLISERALRSQDVIRLFGLLPSFSSRASLIDPDTFKESVLQRPDLNVLIVGPSWFYSDEKWPNGVQITPDMTIRDDHVRRHFFSFEKLKKFQENSSGQLIVLFLSRCHWFTCLFDKRDPKTIHIYIVDSYYHDLSDQSNKDFCWMCASIQAVFRYLIYHWVTAEELE